MLHLGSGKRTLKQHNINVCYLENIKYNLTFTINEKHLLLDPII